MLSETDATQAMGATAYDTNGDKIGKVGQVFLDDQSGQPEFLTVNTGLFGTSESFVPAKGASLDGDRVNVQFTKDVVKDAPKVDIDSGHLDQDEERRLFEYYSMDSGTTTDTTRTDGGTGTRTDTDVLATPATGTSDRTDRTDGDRTQVGHDTSGPTTDQAMTRSEEHLEVGKTTEESGRARLRKYVTTQNETVSVPVRKERAVLESEPITDANVGAAGDGPAISEEEHEVVLHEERAVGQTVATPVERVRLGTETVTEEETVSADVRKENVEVDGDVDGTTGTTGTDRRDAGTDDGARI